MNDLLSDILVKGALGMAIGCARRCGLLDVLSESWTSIPDLARAAGIHPRPAHEILAALITGNIIDAKDDNGLLVKWFTAEDKASIDAMSVYFEEMPILAGCSFDRVAECAQRGVGMGYDDFGPFVRFMGRLSEKKHRMTLISTFVPSVVGVGSRLLAGEPLTIADFGCGSGVAAVLLAKAFPACTVVGLDCDEQALVAARAEAEREGVNNVSFAQLDLSDPASVAAHAQRFDWITAFDSIHDQTQPATALACAHSMLANGGRFSMIDIDAKTDVLANRDWGFAPFMYTVSMMHCMQVGFGTDGQGQALGAMWGREKAISLLSNAGFTATVHSIPHDTFNIHFLCEKTVCC